MDNIKEMVVEPLTQAKFVKPFLLRYKQNNVPKVWECISVHPSVAVIIFNVDRKKLVFVKQFRPAVYFSTHPREDRELIVSKEDPNMASSAEETASLNNCTSSSSKCTQTQRSSVCKRLPDLPGACGITLEMCAGIADKNVDLRQVAKEEVLEECGYEVKLEDLEEVISYRSSVGAAGDRQTMFFTEVTDASKVAAGGGLAAEGELIEVVEMSIEEARQLLKQKAVQSPGEFLFGLMWFLANKASIYEEH